MASEPKFWQEGDVVTAEDMNRIDSGIAQDAILVAQNAESTAEAALEAVANANIPTGGTAGQVLTKTSTGSAWLDAPSGGGTATISDDDFTSVI